MSFKKNFHYLIANKSSSFSSYLGQSTLGHLLLVGAFLLIAYIASFNLLDLRKRNLKLLERSIRVDMVAMPMATMQELKKVSLKRLQGEPVKKEVIAAKKDIINKKDIVFKKKMKKKKNFMDMLKDIKKNHKTVKRKKHNKGSVKTDGKSKAEVEEYNKLILMGNKLSKGNATHGSTSTQSAEALSLYAEQLLVKLKPHWKLPAFLNNKNLSCRIRIYLAKSGRLINAEIFETSSNEEYDNRALQAVRKASPFMSLPKELHRNGINGDIILGFPL